LRRRADGSTNELSALCSSVIPVQARLPLTDSRPSHVFLLYWLPLLAWLGVMLYFTSVPNPYAMVDPEWVPADAVAHVLGYILMGLLLTRLAGRLRGRGLGTVAWALLIAVIYGILDEFHQIPIPGRGFAVMDIVCNATGASIAAGVTAASWRWRRPRPSEK